MDIEAKYRMCAWDGANPPGMAIAVLEQRLDVCGPQPTYEVA